jgi:toxin ParE1/3/4
VRLKKDGAAERNPIRMSARKAVIILQAEARRDIEDILIYSAEQWGLEQRGAYRDEIGRAIEILRGNPRIGRPRDEIAAGLRSFLVRQHVIYYRFTAETVTVLRVMHGKMNVAQHLGEI